MPNLELFQTLRKQSQESLKVLLGARAEHVHALTRHPLFEDLRVCAFDVLEILVEKGNATRTALGSYCVRDDDDLGVMLGTAARAFLNEKEVEGYPRNDLTAAFVKCTLAQILEASLWRVTEIDLDRHERAVVESSRDIALFLHHECDFPEGLYKSPEIPRHARFLIWWARNDGTLTRLQDWAESPL